MLCSTSLSRVEKHCLVLNLNFLMVEEVDSKICCFVLLVFNFLTASDLSLPPSIFFNTFGSRGSHNVEQLISESRDTFLLSVPWQTVRGTGGFSCSEKHSCSRALNQGDPEDP